MGLLIIDLSVDQLCVVALITVTVALRCVVFRGVSDILPVSCVKTGWTK